MKATWMVLAGGLLCSGCERDRSGPACGEDRARERRVSPPPVSPSEKPGGTPSKESAGIERDPAGALQSLLAEKDAYSKSAWDGRMLLFLTLDGIPLEVREHAYQEMSESRRSDYAAWFFKHLAAERNPEDCIAFYRELPYGSQASRAVSRPLFERLMRDCTAETAVEQLFKVDDDYGEGVRFLIETKMGGLRGAAAVVELIGRLPKEPPPARVLDSIVYFDSVELSYADACRLFQTYGQDTDQKNRIIRALITKNSMSHADIVQYMSDSSVPGNTKSETLRLFMTKRATADLEEFGAALRAPAEPSVREAYVLLATPVVLGLGEEQARRFAGTITDSSLKTVFWRSAAYCWSKTNGSLERNPYLGQLDKPTSDAVVAEIKTVLHIK